MTLVKSEDIISKLNELINKINFQPIPFKKLFFAVSSYNDSINFPAITNIKRIRARFLQWTTVTTNKSYMKICIHGIGNGGHVDLMSKHVIHEYFAIMPLTPKASADVYVDYCGDTETENLKSLTSLTFFIAINQATDTVDVPASEITASNPLLCELEFYN